jgi:hypothetical protein
VSSGKAPNRLSIPVILPPGAYLRQVMYRLSNYCDHDMHKV